MPALTRRRNPDAGQESWHVYYGDVRVAIRSGNPFGTDQWQWRCGFYPGSEPGDCTSGTAATFDQARADFEEAWRVFLADRTEADFDEYRKHRAWTAWRYAMWDWGCKLPTLTSDRPVQMLLWRSDRHQGHEPARLCRPHGSRMKFVEPSTFKDPDAAARKLLEIANATEPAQDGRIYIELVNAAFLKAGGTAEQFRAGIQRAIDKGWMVRHESGTYLKFTEAGAALFA